MFSGTKEEFAESGTLTAKYLSRQDELINKVRRKASGSIKITRAKRNNLKNINLEVTTGVFAALTGVSGAGKSSLVEEIIEQHGEKVVLVGQQPLGNNRRASIATYVGVMDEIRDLFGEANHVSPSKFSYNSKAGACPECEGLGFRDMDMNFLGEVRMKCDKCGGKRYREEVLEYRFRGRAINEILEMTAVEAMEFFEQEVIKEKLQMLEDVGLDYIELGQTLDTLSGGEAQRLKLASRLQSQGEFYILDEPTSGLHFADVEKLMKLLNKLVDNGNTVLVIEHNLEVIRQADWIIDMGPEGGDAGGEIVAQGIVENIKNCPLSQTGKYL